MLLKVCLLLDLQDRSSQSRIIDLESQMSQMRAEVARLKREKEEVNVWSIRG